MSVKQVDQMFFFTRSRYRRLIRKWLQGEREYGYHEFVNLDKNFVQEVVLENIDAYDDRSLLKAQELLLGCGLHNVCPGIANRIDHYEGPDLNKLAIILAKLGARDAIPALVNRLNEAQIGGCNIRSFVYDTNSPCGSLMYINRGLIGAMGIFRAMDSVPQLVQFLHNDRLGPYAALALAEIGDPAVVDSIKDSLSDKSDPWGTIQKVSAINSLSDKEFVAPLIDLILACDYKGSLNQYNYIGEIAYRALQSSGSDKASLAQNMRQRIHAELAWLPEHLQRLEFNCLREAIELRRKGYDFRIIYESREGYYETEVVCVWHSHFMSRDEEQSVFRETKPERFMVEAASPLNDGGVIL